jgi:hypothetical protein
MAEGVHGSAGRFPPTSWTQVEAAGHRSTPAGCHALECLLGRYRPLLVRTAEHRLRLSSLEAEDVVQDFLHDKVVHGNLFAEAKRHRGQFRSYLLTCFDHFAQSRHRRRLALRRAPSGGWVPIQELHESEAIAHVESWRHTPPWCWVWAVVAGALLDTYLQWERQGRLDLWEVLCARHRQLQSEDPSSLLLETGPSPAMPGSSGDNDSRLARARRTFHRHLRVVADRYAREHWEIAEELADLRMGSSNKIEGPLSHGPGRLPGVRRDARDRPDDP